MVRAGVLAAAFLAVLVAAAPAGAGIVVWQKGVEIWAMKDDGTKPYRLVDVSKTPGMAALSSPHAYDNGKTIVFEGSTGAAGPYATGVYKYYSTRVTRL